MNYNNEDLLKRNFINDKKLIILSITKRCNLCCLYCRKNKGEWYDVLSQGTSKIDLQKEEWEKIKEIYYKNNVAEILLTGGEPFEYPYIKEFMKYLKENDIKFSLHTNGVNKKIDNLLGEIIGNKINIHLSIEFFEEYQKIVRGGAEYPINLIKKLVENGVNIELKITLHQLMVDMKGEIENRLNYWQNLGIKSIRFQPVASTGNTFDKKLLLNKNFIPFTDELIKLTKNSKYKGFIRNSIDSFESCKKLLSKDKSVCKYADICNMKNIIIFLDTDMNIKNCRTIWNRNTSQKCSEFFDFICCGFQN